MVARSGNGSPSAVVTGIAAAAASVTTPRMPVHDTTTLSCHVSDRRSMTDRHLPGGLPRRRVPRAPRPPVAGTGTLSRFSTWLDSLLRPNMTSTDSGRIAITMTNTISDATATSPNASCASRRSSSTNRRCSPM